MNYFEVMARIQSELNLKGFHMTPTDKNRVYSEEEYQDLKKFVENVGKERRSKKNEVQ